MLSKTITGIKIRVYLFLCAYGLHCKYKNISFCIKYLYATNVYLNYSLKIIKTFAKTNNMIYQIS